MFTIIESKYAVDANYQTSRLVFGKPPSHQLAYGFTACALSLLLTLLLQASCKPMRIRVQSQLTRHTKKTPASIACAPSCVPVLRLHCKP